MEGSDERIEGLLLSRHRHADLPEAADRILHHGLWTPEGGRGDLQAVSLQGAPNYAAMGCGLKMGSKTLVKLGNGLESPGLDSPISKDMGWIALFCMVCVG